MLRFEPVEYLIRCTIQYVLYGPDNDGCAPSNDNLLRVYFVVEIVHRPVIFHIHRDLLFRLAMEHGKRGANLHLAVIRARSKQSSNYAFLGICPTEVVVQDGEKGYWMHRDGGRSASKKSYPVIRIRVFKLAGNSTYPGVEVNPGAAFCMKTADEGGPRGILRGDPGKQRTAGSRTSEAESSIHKRPWMPKSCRQRPRLPSTPSTSSVTVSPPKMPSEETKVRSRPICV